MVGTAARHLIASAIAERSTIRSCASTPTSSARSRCPTPAIPSVAPTARRYGNDAVIECYENLVDWAKTADQLGFDTMWLTEHHFQYEGYEVLPNLIHVRPAPGASDQATCASGRCSTSCRSGTRCAWPRTSRSPTSSPAAGWSSASAAARCRARRGRSAPWSPAATTRCRPSTTGSTARSSKSRWRSSSWPGTRSGSATAASSSCSRPTTCPTAARWSTTSR